MKIENFTYYLKNPSHLYKVSYQELKSMVVQYPYCQNLRYLLVTKSQMDNSSEYQNDLQLAATYSIDRSFLYKQIHQEAYTKSTTDNFVLNEDYLELKDISTPEKVLLETDSEVVEEESNESDAGAEMMPSVSLPQSPEDKIFPDEDFEDFEDEMEEHTEIGNIPGEYPEIEPIAETPKEIQNPPEEAFPAENISDESEMISYIEQPIKKKGKSVIDQLLKRETQTPETEVPEISEGNKDYDHLEESVEFEISEENHDSEILEEGLGSQISEKNPATEIEETTSESSFLLEDELESEPVEATEIEEELIPEELEIAADEIEEEISNAIEQSNLEEILIHEEEAEALLEEFEQLDIPTVKEEDQFVNPEPELAPEDEVETKFPEEENPMSVELPPEPIPKTSFRSWMEQYNPSTDDNDDSDENFEDQEEDFEKLIAEVVDEVAEEKDELIISIIPKDRKKGRKKEKSKSNRKKNKGKGKSDKKEKSKKQSGKNEKNKSKKSSRKKGGKKKKKILKIAKKSIKENDDIVSETLAELLAKQGSRKKAIQMYKRLGLIFPEKNSFFAEKIEKLKK